MQLLVNGLIAGSLAALIAGGLALVYGVLGVFNMALGQMALTGGYSAWWLQAHGVPLPLSILGGLLAGACIAALSFEGFVRPFYKHHRFLPLVTTIALGMILDGLILLLFQERPRAIDAGGLAPLRWGGMTISVPQLLAIGLSLAALCALAWTLHSTAFGRRIRAVVQNDHAALSLGINAPLLHRLIFLGSGVFAAAAGIFLGIDLNLSPTFAFPLTIKAYAAVIAGGKGNVWGAVACAYGIALLEQLVVGVRWFGLFTVPAGYQSTVALAVIIVLLLVKPEGVFAFRVRRA